MSNADESDPTLREKDVLRRALDQQFDQVASKDNIHSEEERQLRALEMQERAKAAAFAQYSQVPPANMVNGASVSPGKAAVGVPKLEQKNSKGKIIQQGLRMVGSSAAMHGELRVYFRVHIYIYIYIYICICMYV